jgi:hypothetical protein
LPYFVLLECPTVLVSAMVFQRWEFDRSSVVDISLLLRGEHVSKLWFIELLGCKLFPALELSVGVSGRLVTLWSEMLYTLRNAVKAADTNTAARQDRDRVAMPQASHAICMGSAQAKSRGPHRSAGGPPTFPNY